MRDNIPRVRKVVAPTTWLTTKSLSAKLNLAPDSFITPYAGGGINILSLYSTTSFADSFTIDNHAGWMAQAGFDVFKYNQGIEGRINRKSTPTLSDREQRLLNAFRALPASKQKRVVDDCEEFASVMGQGEVGQGSLES